MIEADQRHETDARHVVDVSEVERDLFGLEPGHCVDHLGFEGFAHVVVAELLFRDGQHQHALYRVGR